MPTFIPVHASLTSEEERLPEAIFVGGCHGNDSPLCVLPLVSLGSEEVILKKIA